jgi:hypothetical protein
MVNARQGPNNNWN